MKRAGRSILIALLTAGMSFALGSCKKNLTAPDRVIVIPSPDIKYKSCIFQNFAMAGSPGCIDFWGSEWTAADIRGKCEFDNMPVIEGAPMDPSGFEIQYSRDHCQNTESYAYLCQQYAEERSAWVFSNPPKKGNDMQHIGCTFGDAPGLFINRPAGGWGGLALAPEGTAPEAPGPEDKPEPEIPAEENEDNETPGEIILSCEVDIVVPAVPPQEVHACFEFVDEKAWTEADKESVCRGSDGTLVPVLNTESRCDESSFTDLCTVPDSPRPGLTSLRFGEPEQLCNFVQGTYSKVDAGFTRPEEPGAEVKPEPEPEAQPEPDPAVVSCETDNFFDNSRVCMEFSEGSWSGAQKRALCADAAGGNPIDFNTVGPCDPAKWSEPCVVRDVPATGLVSKRYGVSTLVCNALGGVMEAAPEEEPEADPVIMRCELNPEPMPNLNVCIDFSGEDWTEEAKTEVCKSAAGSNPITWSLTDRCDESAETGYCAFENDPEPGQNSRRFGIPGGFCGAIPPGGAWKDL